MYEVAISKSGKSVRLIAIVAMYLVFQSIQAQDTLYMKDESVRLVNVLEINRSQIRYKKHGEPESPVYVISFEMVRKLRLQNGELHYFNLSENGKTAGIQKSEKPQFKRNEITFNYFDLLFRFLSLSYERKWKNGEFGLRIPLSMGFKSYNLGDYDYDAAYYNEYKTFSTGIELRMYPVFSDKLIVSYGPSLEFGQFDYTDYRHPLPNQVKSANFYSIIMQSSLGFLLSDEFNFSFDLGFGITSTAGIHGLERETLPTIRFACRMGFSF